MTFFKWTAAWTSYYGKWVAWYFKAMFQATTIVILFWLAFTIITGQFK